MDYLTLAVLSALWGTSFLLIKIAAGGLTPAAFAFGRVAVAASALAALSLVMGWRWPHDGRTWVYLLAMAAIGQAAPILALGAAAKLTTSGDLALMMGAAPAATMLCARAFGMGEVWSWRAAFGLAVGLAGVGLAVGAPVDATLYPQATLGRALGLAAAVFYSLGALMSRAASRRIGPAMTATASLTLSAFVLLGVWLVIGGPAQAANAPLASLEALLTLGIVNTALAYLVYFRLVATAGATFAALNNYIVPFVGLVLGAVVMAEPVAWASWLGPGRRAAQNLAQRNRVPCGDR